MKLRKPLFLRRDAMRLGWPGWLGLAGLALALGLQVAVLQPARERVAAARRTVLSMQQRLVLAGPGAHQAKVLSVDEQLAAFRARFPSERQAADVVGRIAAIAGRHGLLLQQADYKSERDKALRLSRLQMNVPLHGPYPAIRQFLSALRAEMPLVSLEQVQFERQKVGDAAVDARLRLVFYLGDAS